MNKPLPVLFAAHGSPLNAIEDNDFTRALKEWGRRLPRPKAVLCVSAHWYGDGVKVMSNPHPRTIHDFGGFPPALYEVRYPAPGDPALAADVRDLLPEATLSDEWGLDHGAWSVLTHLFPAADVPVVQLSLDRRLDAQAHLALGKHLAPLRQMGVLILGSGNIVHNLAAMTPEKTYSWAANFDENVKKALNAGEQDALTRYHTLDGARESVPAPDHYLPLLYALGAADTGGEVTFPTEGFELGAISLRSVQWG